MPADPSRILIRTTGGARVGMGHYRRALTLAEALALRGASIRMLLVGDEAAAALAATATVPIELQTMGAEPDRTTRAAAAHGAELVIVDDYALTGGQLAAIREAGFAVAVIDDLADRRLAVDLVLNAAPQAPTLPYQLGAQTRTLLGPGYALLREAFADVPPRLAPAEVEHVLVLLGGSDPLGLTARVVEEVRAQLPSATLDVILGPLATRPTLPTTKLRVHVAPPDLAELMQAAQLAISAAGQTLYELLASGVPTLAIQVADNQRPQLEALSALGAVLPVEPAALGARVEALAKDRPLRQALIARGQALVDGHGASRAAHAIQALIAERRRSTHG